MNRLKNVKPENLRDCQDFACNPDESCGAAKPSIEEIYWGIHNHSEDEILEARHNAVIARLKDFLTQSRQATIKECIESEPKYTGDRESCEHPRELNGKKWECNITMPCIMHHNQAEVHYYIHKLVKRYIDDFIQSIKKIQ